MSPATNPLLVDAEELARAFHESYERLAPQYNYRTRRGSAVPWEDVPESNRRLMIATAGEVINRIRAEDRRIEALAEAELGESWSQELDSSAPVTVEVPSTVELPVVVRTESPHE